MVEDASEKLAKLKSALLVWYTTIPKMRENNVSCYCKNDMDRANKLFGEIVDLERQLQLSPSDKFRILMELI